jgi:hypothetical protein
VLTFWVGLVRLTSQFPNSKPEFVSAAVKQAVA